MAENAAKLKNSGDLCIEAQEYEKAVEYYGKAIQLDPGNATYYKYRGNAWNYLGRYSEALKDYEKALKLKPDFASCYSNRGIVLQQLGRNEEAFIAFQKAIELEPNDADFHNNCAAMLFKAHRFEEALNEYRCSLNLTPDDLDLYGSIALTLYNLGRYEEALETCKKVHQIAPTNQKYSELYQNMSNMIRYSMQNEQKTKKQSDQYQTDGKHKQYSWRLWLGVLAALIVCAVVIVAIVRGNNMRQLAANAAVNSESNISEVQKLIGSSVIKETESDVDSTSTVIIENNESNTNEPQSTVAYEQKNRETDSLGIDGIDAATEKSTAYLEEMS